jgi:hypothetical protein
MSKILNAAVFVLLLSTVVHAELVGVPLGPDAPPATLGGYDMIPFPPDPQPVSPFQDVTTVEGPTGDLTFNPNVSHRRIGEGWATWSHGYTGDVYYSAGAPTTITLPPDTGAFIVFAEPGPFGLFPMTATAQDGTVISQLVEGQAGASGFGFYSTEGSPLTSVEIELFGISAGFGIGEFSIAPIPEPATIALIALGGAVLLRRN